MRPEPISAESDDAAAETAEITETAAPEQTAEAAPSAAPELPGDNDYMWLSYNGEMVLLFKSFYYGKTYVESDDGSGGFLHADGVAFLVGLRAAIGTDDVRSKLPEVGPGFKPIYAEDCRLTGIRVYDTETLEPLESGLTFDGLLKFIDDSESDVVVQMIVLHTGRYIEAMEENEHDAYSFAFIVKKTDD